MRFSALKLVMLSFVFAVSFALLAPPIKATHSSNNEWTKENEKELQKRNPAIKQTELKKFGYTYMR